MMSRMAHTVCHGEESLLHCKGKVKYIFIDTFNRRGKERDVDGEGERKTHRRGLKLPVVQLEKLCKTSGI